MTCRIATLATVCVMGLASTGHTAVIRYVAAGGNWSNTAVWDSSSGLASPGDSVPNGSSDTATFNDSNSNRTLALDLDVVLGTLTNTNRKYLEINKVASNTLTFRTDSGNATVGVTNTSTNQSGVDGDKLQIEPDVILDLLGKSLAVTQADRVDDSRTNRIAFRGSITGTGDISVTNNDGTNNSGGQTIFKAINSVGAITANPTNAGRIRFEGAIGSNVTSFTKNGSGVAQLLAVNSYAGGTTINAGTLEVGASGTLGSAAPLVIADGAVLNLLADQISQGEITSLTLGANVFTALGTYGHSSSGATYTNDTFFAGTGFVTLIPEPGTMALASAGLLLMLPRRTRNA